MNKNLILKGEMRVMTFGENPSEGVLVYEFTSLEAVECEGENKKTAIFASITFC